MKQNEKWSGLLLTACLLLTIFVGCGKSPSIPSSSELSAELKTEIEEAWQNRYGTGLLWNEGDGYMPGFSQYYGTYKGMVVWFFSDSNLPAEESITVAGQKMVWGYKFNIYVYVDETVYTITEAYNCEFLSDKDVKQIATIHHQFCDSKR